MTEVVRGRTTLNNPSVDGTNVFAENVCMEPMTTNCDGSKTTGKKKQPSPDINANRPDVAVAVSGDQDTDVASVKVEEANDISDEALLQVRQKDQLEGCHNLGFQHDGFPVKYTQPSYKEEFVYKQDHNCPVCFRTLTVVAMVISACILVAVIFLIVGHFTALAWSQNGAASVHLYSTSAPEAPPSIRLQVHSSLQLQKEYLPSYNDPASPEFKSLELQFLSYITEIMERSHMRDRFESAEVTQFHAGSVVVDFIVNFRQQTSTDSPSNESYLKAVIKTEVEFVLNEGTAEDTGGDLNVQEGSLQVMSVDILDEVGSTHLTATLTSPTTAQYQGVLNSVFCGLRPGYSPIRHRIVQGITSDLGKWPWLGSLRIAMLGTGQKYFHVCGATLISERWAATAAHCVSSPSFTGTLLENILLGDTKLEVASPSRQVIPVERIHVHPGYSPNTHQHDIALIKLARLVDITDYIRPVCLERKNTESENYQRCYVAGWGVTEYQGNQSLTLLDARMNLINLGDCIEKYKFTKPQGFSPTEGSVCLESAEQGTNAGPCNGDSGGPVMCEGDEGRWHMVGLISLAVACNITLAPVVSTRVSAYWDYIAASVDDNSNHAECVELTSMSCSQHLPYNTIYSGDQASLEPILESILSFNLSCNEHVQTLLCSLVYKGCVTGNRSLVPCIEFCRAVVDDCNDAYIKAHDLDLAYVAKCDNLPQAPSPDQMMCFKDQDLRCGNQLTISLLLDDQIRLQSHNFSGRYASNLDCVYVISAPQGHCVMVKVRKISLQDIDVLEIGQGRDAYDKTTVLVKHQGTGDSPAIVSEGESVWIHFSSGPIHTQDVNGYDLEIHTVNSTYVSTLCQNSSVDDSLSYPDWWKCDGVVDCPTGFDEADCPMKLPDVLNGPNCGVRPPLPVMHQTQFRIVNGTRAEAGTWPWLAYLSLDNVTDSPVRVICGATLIGDRWLTTAAHCVASPALEILISEVTVGDTHLREQSPYHQRVPIERIFVHPGYNNRIQNNDIAVLKLARPVQFNENVRPVCLDTPSEGKLVNKYSKCYVAGWGRTGYEESQSSNLLEAQMMLVELDDCTEQYEDFRMWGLTITDRVTCVKSADTDVSGTACNGDSGGPLMCRDTDGRWNMVGIVSLGYRCTDHPVVVTRVSAYMDYIVKIIEGDPHPAKCETLRSETCSGLLPFDQTFSTSQEAFDPVIAIMLGNVTCSSANLDTFICMLLFEGCTDDGRAQIPCREFCDHLMLHCNDEYTASNHPPLDAIAKCSIWPHGGRPDQMVCYRSEDARCGNQTEIILPPEGSITLQSHNYPYHYGMNLDCITVVHAPPGHRVFIKMHELDVEGCCETLAFGSGRDAHDKRTTLSKFHWPEDIKVIVSPEESLWVRFVTRNNPIADGRGFSLDVYVINATAVPHLCNNESVEFPYSPPDWWNCDGIIDCPNGLDEDSCPVALLPMPTDFFNQAGCGVEPAGSSLRIVGGSEASPGQWPWLGSLRYKWFNAPKIHGCAASLITHQWLLTAAHCVVPRIHKKGSLTVVFGDSRLDEVTTHHVEIAVESLHLHPGYTGDITFEHDIALLKLVRPVTYTDRIKPICLNTDRYEVHNYTLCYVAGWGKTNLSAANLSNSQMEVEMNLLSQSACVQSVRDLGLFGIVTDNFICAEGDEGQSTCGGDSGGALVCRSEEGIWHEVGVVSAGYGCSSEWYPGLYTRIAKYVDFINTTIHGDSEPSCKPLEPQNNCTGLVPYSTVFTTTQTFYEDLINRMYGFEECFDRAREILCMMLLPSCDGGVPCRDFCQEFVDNCSSAYFEAVQTPLSWVINCENYPVGPPGMTSCVNGVDARCSMSNQDGDIYVPADGHATLYSPHHPLYDSSLVCTWLVSGPPTTRALLIKFLSMDYNYKQENVLAVGYGHSPQNLSTKLQHYSGKYNAGSLLVPSNEGWIWFATVSMQENDHKSMEAFELGGFELEIYATNVTHISDLCTVPRGAQTQQADLTTMPSWWYCDGFPDCPSGADEVDCPVPWYNESYFLNSATCGIAGAAHISSPRIVGGVPSTAGTWPWMVSLRDSSGEHKCGATLIAEHWALSAAHCLGYIDHAVLGDVSLDRHSPYHTSVKVKEIYTYGDYDDYNMGASVDLALVRFVHPVQFNDQVSVACLPPPDMVVEDNATFVGIGWGHLVENGSVANDLQEVELPRMSAAVCQELVNVPGAFMGDFFICAGYSQGGMDTCQGDSGGPLLYEGDDGRWYVVGVTSFGLGCARPDSPGYYANVAIGMDFLLAVLRGENHTLAVKTEVYP